MHSAGGINFTLNLFRPAEAAVITRLSTLMQRDWRDRGYLPSVEGYARYDVFDLARMYIMRSMSDHGIGPKYSGEYSSKAANALVYSLLRVGEAYENCEKYLTRQDQIEDIRNSLVCEEYRYSYMIWWANYTAEFCNDIGEAFGREYAREKGRRSIQQEGPVIVLNLEYAPFFNTIAPRPLVRLLPPGEPSS